MSLIRPKRASISRRSFCLCCNLQQPSVTSFGNPKSVQILMRPLVKLGHRSSGAGLYGLIRGIDIAQRIIAAQLFPKWSKEISDWQEVAAAKRAKACICE